MNASKKRDWRCWERWEAAGAIGVAPIRYDERTNRLRVSPFNTMRDFARFTVETGIKFRFDLVRKDPVKRNSSEAEATS